MLRTGCLSSVLIDEISVPNAGCLDAANGDKSVFFVTFQPSRLRKAYDFIINLPVSRRSTGVLRNCA